MRNQLKKLLALGLAMLTVLGLFSACSAGEPAPSTEPEVTTEPTTESVPAETQNAEEALVLRILTLGHSLAVDSCHMLNLISAVEGIGKYDEIYIGTLYYSGCPLTKHVEFSATNQAVYNLYLSSTNTPDAPPTIDKLITMKDALSREYWDIVIMQGGAFEVAKEESFQDNKIQAIRNYAMKHNLNKYATFAWHMPWATPTTNSLRDKYPYSPNPYYTNYAMFNDQRSNFYNAITNCVSKYIVTDPAFQFVIPSGTAIENALSSYMEETDLHRDYGHASDVGRVIASYTWYCRLMGVDQLEQIKLDAIPKAFLKSTKDKTKDYVLTDAEKAIILESVNNALKNPLQMTQSQYTQAPAK